MPQDDETPFLEPPDFLGTPTVERMAENLQGDRAGTRWMAPEERAAHLTNRTFQRQRADEKHFAGKSTEERQQTLDARESFHDRIRERNTLTRLPSLSSSRCPLPWLEPTPERLLGAEATLKGTWN